MDDLTDRQVVTALIAGFLYNGLTIPDSPEPLEDATRRVVGVARAILSAAEASDE